MRTVYSQEGLVIGGELSPEEARAVGEAMKQFCDDQLERALYGPYYKEKVVSPAPQPQTLRRKDGRTIREEWERQSRDGEGAQSQRDPPESQTQRLVTYGKTDDTGA